MAEVTFVPVLAAGFAAAIIGMIWYHPRVFGGVWMRFANITPEMAEHSKKMRPITTIVGILAAMLIAWVMNYVGVLFGVYDIVSAVVLGFWCWIGFTAPVLLGQVLWEHKPIRFYLINASYWLIAFVVMAVILLY
jgi:hypothetical protein